MKLCKTCNLEKQYSDFTKNKREIDGLDYYCKICKSKIKAMHYQNNKETVKIYTKNYRDKNQEIISKKKKIYNLNNKHKIIEHRQLPEVRFNTSKRTAKSRKIVWNLTSEQYLELLLKPCYYCCNKLANVQNSAGIGLDRINNIKSIGYSMGNILTCCKICNKIKNNFLNVEETVAAVHAILEIRKSINLKLVKK